MFADTQISDLFFNTEHPEYDRKISEIMQDDSGEGIKVTIEQIKDAIFPEAHEFARQYPQFGKSAKWFVEDFVKRV